MSHARIILTVQQSFGIPIFSENTIYDYELTFLIVFNLIKIIAALWFAAGEEIAGYVLVFGFQLLRMIFKYNPFQISNQGPDGNFTDDNSGSKGYDSEEWLLSMKQRKCY